MGEVYENKDGSAVEIGLSRSSFALSSVAVVFDVFMCVSVWVGESMEIAPDRN